MYRSMRVFVHIVLCICVSTILRPLPIHAAATDDRYYTIGAPHYQPIWVDPLAGDDTRDGLTAATAVQHLATAWERIPAATPLTTTGYQILLQPGQYDASQIPSIWQHRWGNALYPIEIRAAAGLGSVEFTQPMQMNDVAYVYLRDIVSSADSTYALTCTSCQNILVASTTFQHGGIFFAQTYNMYVEDSRIADSAAAGIVLSAVHGGHIQHTQMTNAHDACIQLRAGSANIRIEANTINGCGDAGVVIGPGSALENMQSPWIHYEAYDITVANNIIMHTTQSGAAVYGGYHILVAYNTFYDIGGTQTMLTLAQARRTCAGVVVADKPNCSAQLARRGWGTNNPTSAGEPIPNRSVFIYNNLIVNPPTTSNSALLFVAPAQTPGTYSGIPAPSSADDNVQIAGNLFWNSSNTLLLGIDSTSGCNGANFSCNEPLIRATNHINDINPSFVDATNGDMHLQSAVPTAVIIPVMPDRRPAVPEPPLAPTTRVTSRDMRNMARAQDFIGAYASLADKPTITPDTSTATTTASPAPARITVTQTFTPSKTFTRTVSRTASNTRTASATFTASNTRTASMTPTRSTTTTKTRTLSATITPSNTATLGVLAANTLTPTASRTPTATFSPSNTRTMTATATASRTASSTRTPTVSRTASLTVTPTITRTASHTSTMSRTRTASLTATITLTATPIEQIPIVPRIQAVDKTFLHTIYTFGIASGKNPQIFAKIGDSITASPDFLNDIGCFAENLGDYTSLQDTISFYRQKKLAQWLSTAWCHTSNPFNVDSVAALPGWRAAYALSPDWISPRYQGYCNIDNITPLDCELRLMKPSVVLIMYGTNDIAHNDVENFAGSLNYIVLTCLSRGVIPVVSTIPPRLDDPTKGARVERFNSAIITIAHNNHIPVWNYWLALQAPEMINYGLSADGVHPSVYQSTRSADFRPEALRYGYNQRNLTALQVLDHIRNVVMLDGPADP